MGVSEQEIINMVEKMPAFPQSVHRVMELAADINCNPRDLVEVIEHDPVLILKILKLVNPLSARSRAACMLPIPPPTIRTEPLFGAAAIALILVLTPLKVLLLL
ncbi:MAG: HDOD domain-containing protein [Nitrospirae bacterium]|nr:HDOD domain-containing protein [Nitrospirota bacterium]